MSKPSNTRFDGPDVDGPDYVALVIEWAGPVDTIEDQITTPTRMPTTRWQQLVRRAQPVVQPMMAKVQPVIDRVQPTMQPIFAKMQPIMARIGRAPLIAFAGVGAIALAGWGIHRLRAA